MRTDEDLQALRDRADEYLQADARAHSAIAERFESQRRLIDLMRMAGTDKIVLPNGTIITIPEDAHYLNVEQGTVIGGGA